MGEETMNGRFPFNVRVYGLLIENERVLIADERIHNRLITKFPGGGLEFGEGPVECIVREWKEELDQDVEVMEHFYTTHFFQRSAFRKSDQVLSIYYKLTALEPLKVDLRQKKFDLRDGEEAAFRWLHIQEAVEEELTFPVDKVVLSLLKDPKGKTNRYL